MPPKSDIWKYFLKQDKNQARCKVCGKVLKTSGNTTNLRGHFKTHTTKNRNENILTLTVKIKF